MYLNITHGFKNEFPFVYGSFGFPFSFVENIPNGFFEMELYMPNGIVTKQFGKIMGNSIQKKFETFIRADTVITVF